MPIVNNRIHMLSLNRQKTGNGSERLSGGDQFQMVHKWVQEEDGSDFLCLPQHYKICSAVHNKLGFVQTLFQKDRRTIPTLFEFDARKLFKTIDRHWNDYFETKKVQQKHKWWAFDPKDPNFEYTFDLNEDPLRVEDKQIAAPE
jgi:hypothetical protein